MVMIWLPESPGSNLIRGRSINRRRTVACGPSVSGAGHSASAFDLGLDAHRLAHRRASAPEADSLRSRLNSLVFDDNAG